MRRKITIIASAEMGPGTFEAKFLPLLRGNHVECIYVLRKEKGPDIENINYIILPVFSSNKILGLLVRPLYLVYYTWKVKADLILAYHLIPHSFFAYFTYLLTKKRFIIAQTGLFIQGRSENNLLFRRIIKKIIGESYYFFVPGKSSYSFWCNLGVSSKKLKILHSTIDTDFFSPANKIKKEYDFIILSRLVDEKRIDILIELLNKLKEDGHDFRAVIVGDGNKYNELVNLVSRLELSSNIEFVGFQKNTKLWFNKAKYYLMYSYSEGLPTSLMQAMSCGLVPISTDVGNISDLINNENGFIYPYGDKLDYYEAMKLLLKDFSNDKYVAYSSNCRNAIIKDHSYKSAVKKWDEVFKNLNYESTI